MANQQHIHCLTRGIKILDRVIAIQTEKGTEKPMFAPGKGALNMVEMNE
jgi:hypothetical protein